MYYRFTNIYNKHQPNVGKYRPYMDGMGNKYFVAMLLKNAVYQPSIFFLSTLCLSWSGISYQRFCGQHGSLLLLPFGCFLYPQNTPKTIMFSGKPIVVGCHHFRKPLFIPQPKPCIVIFGKSLKNCHRFASSLITLRNQWSGTWFPW